MKEDQELISYHSLDGLEFDSTEEYEITKLIATSEEIRDRWKEESSTFRPSSINYLFYSALTSKSVKQSYLIEIIVASIPLLPVATSIP